MHINLYHPIKNGVLTGISALILWYFSVLAINPSVVPDDLLGLLDYIFKFVSVVIAALTGAYCAFRFNVSLEEKKRVREASTSE